ncbi:MAG: DUF2703 domain-containing protein [Nitrospinales bacterium]
MKIEFLYFDGCPNHEPALELLRQVLAEEGIDAPVETINVTSGEQAVERRFLGSPSIHIDGRDVEKEARASADFGRGCRIYLWNGTPKGYPSSEMIRAAVRECDDHPRG